MGGCSCCLVTTVQVLTGYAQPDIVCNCSRVQSGYIDRPTEIRDGSPDNRHGPVVVLVLAALGGRESPRVTGHRSHRRSVARALRRRTVWHIYEYLAQDIVRERQREAEAVALARLAASSTPRNGAHTRPDGKRGAPQERLATRLRVRSGRGRHGGPSPSRPATPRATAGHSSLDRSGRLEGSGSLACPRLPRGRRHRRSPARGASDHVGLDGQKVVGMIITGREGARTAHRDPDPRGGRHRHPRAAALPRLAAALALAAAPHWRRARPWSRRSWRREPPSSRGRGHRGRRPPASRRDGRPATGHRRLPADHGRLAALLRCPPGRASARPGPPRRSPRRRCAGPRRGRRHRARPPAGAHGGAPGRGPPARAGGPRSRRRCRRAGPRTGMTPGTRSIGETR